MKKYVLFDLDGTLVDSGPGIKESIKYAVEKMGMSIPEGFDMDKFVGPPLYKSFDEFLGLKGDDINLAVKYYRERYSDTGLFDAVVYPGIKELLKKLVESGYELYVATSKPEVFARKIIQHFGMDEYFTEVVGSLLDGNRINKSDVINHILGNIECEMGDDKLKNVIIIGDRYFDVNGARETNMNCIGITFGYGSREELEGAGAFAVVDTTDEVFEIIEKYMA